MGPLLVLLGLVQFIFVVYEHLGAEPLAALGALLRMALGLVLLNAALDRSAMTTQKMRKRFERLADRSLQGILIRLGDRSIVYANPTCLAIYGIESLESLKTERHTTNLVLLQLALHDELTGLPNRTSMINSLRNRCVPDQLHSDFC